MCSNSLKKRLEPALYDPIIGRNKALRWACANCNPNVLHRAISYGASVSSLEVPTQRSPGTPRPVTVLTLYLAVRHNRPDTFSLLLGLGATVDCPETGALRGQIKTIMRWLASPPNLGLLHTFLESRLDSHVRTIHCPAVAWPLIPAISSGAGPDLVRLLLDHGADPDQVISNPRRGVASPLSAAIFKCSQPVARVLVERGASIHGKHARLRRKYPTHLPMFAAAAVMATSEEGQGMMELCLQHGGDINQYSCSTGGPWDCYWVTPLLVYLDLVPSWTTSDDGGKGALGRLTYLLDQGASGPPPGTTPPKKLMPHSYPSESPSTVEVLLDKWGLAKMTEDSFFSVMKLLVGRGLDAVHTKRLLHKYYLPSGPQSNDAVTGWKRLLEEIVAQPQVDVDTLLAQLIIDESLSRSVDSGELGDLFRITAKSLQEHGAKINAPACQSGETALHRLCLYYDVNSAPSYLWDLYWTRYPPVARWWRELFSFLMEMGADPTIAFKGKTAIDVLLARPEGDSIPARSCLLELVGILKGES